MIPKNDLLRGRVFASLRPGEISVHVAYGYGMNNGGGLWHLPRHLFPIDCRLPNTYVWVHRSPDWTIRTTAMTEQEVRENHYGDPGW